VNVISRFQAETNRFRYFARTEALETTEVTQAALTLTKFLLFASLIFSIIKQFSKEVEGSTRY
jgi:hypothetical protein